ncbi:uncharacterized protein TNCV_3248061 [Trichonephila clavipes]|nr:uncharacterized protein TNCV_3248061 [Trichonephila clavipes]
MRKKEDILIKDLLLEEKTKELLEQRKFLRNDAKRTSKPCIAIQRTQFGAGLKLRPKFSGPYKVTKVNSKDRYEVEKVGQHEGPNSTITSADLMRHFDEEHFWLNGYVSKQNCRIWSEANPQVYVETPLHPEILTVWCALWAGGIIGPYFFKNDEGHNELWFQQDGTTCHTARATIDLLKDTFGDRLISRFGPVNWPPRSCDLTPLNYFLWGYLKSLVYADKPQTLDHLEDNIHRVIANIRPQMLEKSHRKLDVQIGLHPSQPWQSYARNHN